MVSKTASIFSLFRGAISTLTKPRPRTSSAPMPNQKRLHSISRPTARKMSDSNNVSSFLRSRASAPPSSSLIAFYDGTGTDGRGRTLEQILDWGAGRLEQSHDYIQTLFPLPEASGVNDSAPIIKREVRGWQIPFLYK